MTANGIFLKSKCSYNNRLHANWVINKEEIKEGIIYTFNDKEVINDGNK